MKAGSRRSPASVTETVAWTIQRRDGWRGFLARAAEIAVAVVNVHGGWALSPTDARLPASEEKVLDVDPPLVRGNASFMPRYVDEPGLAMEVFLDRATVTVPRGYRTVELVVPLSRFAIVGHRRLSGRWFPKGPTAEWELVLATDDGAERITVKAAWLTLAWLAHLGGWREPLTS